MIRFLIRRELGWSLILVADVRSKSCLESPVVCSACHKLIKDYRCFYLFADNDRIEGTDRPEVLTRAEITRRLFSIELSQSKEVECVHNSGVHVGLTQLCVTALHFQPPAVATACYAT